jgi:hypothetical protein
VACGGFMLLVGITVLILGICLIMKNRKRERKGYDDAYSHVDRLTDM